MSVKKKLLGAITIGALLGTMGCEGETNQSPIKRIYCSANSIGLDFHFNEITGQIYSYDKNKKLLIPFNIREELPFSDFYPKEELREITQASKFINAKTSIKKDNLVITLTPSVTSGQSGYINIGFNLENLKIKLDLDVPELEDSSPIPIALVIPLINSQINCEYIPPESQETAL